MNIAIAELREKVLGTLRQNYSEEDSAKVADYLIWAEMSANKTQGIIKMTGSEPLQSVKPEHEITKERDTQLSTLLNAGKNPAPLASQVATDIVIAKAKEHGFGIVGVHNFFTSNGAQAFYAEKIARQDLIGIALSRSAASMAGFGGIDAVFGTNPIGYAFPTNEDPLVFDMAASAMTWYGLILAKARNESIPEGMAIDHEGNPTVDPEAAMNGALLPFDHGYKGAGLGMVVEMLAGPLVGATYAQLEGDWGALFMAIDPNLLVDVADFKNHASDLVQKLKSARTKPDQAVRLPGERALAARKAAEASGMVDVEEAILKQLNYI